MFCCRKSNNKINRLHEISFRTDNNDHENTYEKPLSHHNYIYIHEQNEHRLANEICC